MLTETGFVVAAKGDSGAGPPASICVCTSPRPVHEIISVSPACAGVAGPTVNCVPSGWTPTTRPAPAPEPLAVNVPGSEEATDTDSGTDSAPPLSTMTCWEVFSEISNGTTALIWPGPA